MSDPTARPNWVTKPDGRVEPFDGDRISGALFAAIKRIGPPNAFLARELTDGVLHFLAADAGGDQISLGDLLDAIVKVVRELGHPVLARAIQESGVRNQESGVRSQGSTAADIGLLPADLRAAEREGLIHFFDADVRPKLAAVVMAPVGRAIADSWIEAITFAREQAGQFVAIDCPEFAFATPAAAAKWATSLASAARTSGLRTIVNLNAAQPPAWATTVGSGPLFWQSAPDNQVRRNDIAEAIALTLLETASDTFRIDWHLGGDDFLPANQARLRRLAEAVCDGKPLAFVMDRPRRPVALAEGLDREHPAVLRVVGVGLAALFDAFPDAFFTKLGSVARFAIAAGHVHRAALRRDVPSEVLSQFLLDRARLMVVPVGLDDIARSLAKQSNVGDDLDAARSVLLGLQAALQRDAARIPAMIDGPVALTAAGADPRQQLRSAAALHTAIGWGTAEIDLTRFPDPGPDEPVELLSYAGQLPGLSRFMFRFSAGGRQKPAGW